MGRQGWWTRERGTLWVCDLENAPPSPVSARCAATFQEIDGATCEQLATVMGVSSPEPALTRLKSGRRCFVAVIGGAVASYAWASRGCEHVGELERAFVLPEGDCYLWDCATLPAHRGQRLYTALLGHVLVTLQAEGVSRVWIGASRANRPSIRGIALAGFRQAVSTHYLRLWHLRSLWVIRLPQASPTLTADAVRMMAQRHERRVGPLLFGVGEPSGQPCGAV